MSPWRFFDTKGCWIFCPTTGEAGDSYQAEHSSAAGWNASCIYLLVCTVFSLDYRNLHTTLGSGLVSDHFSPSSGNVSCLAWRECDATQIESWRADALMGYGCFFCRLHSSYLHLRLTHLATSKNYNSLKSIALPLSFLLQPNLLCLQNITSCSFNYSLTIYPTIPKILQHSSLSLTPSISFC